MASFVLVTFPLSAECSNIILDSEDESIADYSQTKSSPSMKKSHQRSDLQKRDNVKIIDIFGGISFNQSIFHVGDVSVQGYGGSPLSVDGTNIFPMYYFGFEADIGFKYKDFVFHIFKTSFNGFPGEMDGISSIGGSGVDGLSENHFMGIMTMSVDWIPKYNIIGSDAIFVSIGASLGVKTSNLINIYGADSSFVAGSPYIGFGYIYSFIDYCHIRVEMNYRPTLNFQGLDYGIVSLGVGIYGNMGVAVSRIR